MAWYMTEYRGNWAPIGKYEEQCRPGIYSAFIWASSRSQARHFARQRGMGERIVWQRGSRGAPYERASTILRKRKMAKRKYELIVLHSLCFLSQVALASGAATLQETVGDGGILHDYCHQSSRRERLIELVEHIERRVPGYWPHKKRAAAKRP